MPASKTKKSKAPAKTKGAHPAVGTVLTPPWCVQVEFTEGCSRECSFCAVPVLKGGVGGYKFMTLETAEILFKQFADFIPDKRFELGMRGEPTMNPKYLKLIELFRRYLPKAQLMLVTNGVRMRKGKMEKVVRDVFAAGADFIMLDTYYPEREELFPAAFELPKDITVIDFYRDEYKLNPWYNNHRKLNNTVFVLDDLSKMSGIKRTKILNNHCGNAADQPTPQEPMMKKCVLPFRQFVVHWDGVVDFCCNDFGRDLVIGDIRKRTVEDMWWGKEMTAIRAMLRHGDRRFAHC